MLGQPVDLAVKRGCDRAALDIELVDESADGRRDPVVVVAVISAGRLHAPDVAEKRGRMVDRIRVRKKRIEHRGHRKDRREQRA